MSSAGSPALSIAHRLLSSWDRVGCGAFLLLMPSEDGKEALRNSTLHRIVSGHLQAQGWAPYILVIEIATQPSFEAVLYSNNPRQSFNQTTFHTL
jgi:hypothetical protein